MHITVNGNPAELPEQATVADLLTRLSVGEGRIAVELNGDIVPRSSFDRQPLKSGDSIEIVQAIGGG